MKDSQQNFRGIGLAFFISTLIIASLGVGYFLGILIDKKFNSAPWGMVISIGLCITVGFVDAYKIARRYFNN
jgi:F0F1-type ATP synthase assembly protein I